MRMAKDRRRALKRGKEEEEMPLQSDVILVEDETVKALYRDDDDV